MRRMLCIVGLSLAAASCDRQYDYLGPSPQPFFQTMNGTVSLYGSTYHPLSVPYTGTMYLTLSWNDPAIDLDLYLAGPGCTNVHPLDGCGYYAASDSSVGVVRETITRTVYAGESYTIWIDNLSLRRASTYNISLSIQ
jgi:hypothetical protein